MQTIDDVTRSLILALGVCYHASLDERDKYRKHVAQKFAAPCRLLRGADDIEEIIAWLVISHLFTCILFYSHEKMDSKLSPEIIYRYICC